MLFLLAIIAAVSMSYYRGRSHDTFGASILIEPGFLAGATLSAYFSGYFSETGASLFDILIIPILPLFLFCAAAFGVGRLLRRADERRSVMRPKS